jgi:hypothetical protein
MSVITTIASLYRRARWSAEVAAGRVRDGRLPVPSITVSGPSPGLVRRLVTCIVCFVVGAAMSWWYCESIVNAKWRAQLAEQSSAVRAAMARGGAIIEATDREAVEAVGGLDARIRELETALAGTATSVDQCLVSVSCIEPDSVRRPGS